MPIINVTLPSDGTNADVADFNDPITQILATVNGFLDDDNIASLSGSKILANTIPESALTATSKNGYLTAAASPTAVAYLGQRSYSLTYAASILGYKSPGMRSRFTRTNAAPIQCADLEASSSHYFNKTSPNKMTWTDDFSGGAWVKLESLPGARMAIASRWNGTSGWVFDIDSTGAARLLGYNAGAGNVSYVQTVQSVPLNKWIHIAAQLDMSAFTATTTTSYVMLDGIDVPAVVARAGTNPTALIQAGNLEIGSLNGGTSPFDGKLAQVGLFNAKVTQANWRTYMSQTFSGSESALASAYSLSNSITDLMTTTPNDLTAQNSAVATATDSPFGNSGVSTTLEYGITMAISSDGLTETVQVPEGCMIPTSSSGVASVSYSMQAVPYNFPRQKSKWDIVALFRTQVTLTSNATYGAYNSGNDKITIPLGDWSAGYELPVFVAANVACYFNLSDTNITGLTNTANIDWTTGCGGEGAANNYVKGRVRNPVSLSVATVYTLYTLGATTSGGIDSDNQLHQFIAENAWI